MRQIVIDEVLEGMKLGETIIDNNGMILLSSGKLLTRQNIESLKGRGYCALTIDDAESAGIELSRPVSNKTEMAIMKALKTFDVEAVQNEAKNLVAELMDGNLFLADMDSIKTYDNYTYQHSLSVGTLAAISGLAAGFTAVDAERLTCAGLLHDLGKTMIDQSVINAPRKLTNEEFQEVRRHSEIGYDMLKDNIDIPAAVRVAIYQHHENEDGSGYPRQVKGDKIHKYAKIIHCCDVFDALTSKRPYREPIPRWEALDYLKHHTNDMFSKLYTMVFTRCVCPFPTGMTLKMSDGSEAIVTHNSSASIDDPVIRVIGRPGEAKLSETGLMIRKEIKPDSTLK